MNNRDNKKQGNTERERKRHRKKSALQKYWLREGWQRESARAKRGKGGEKKEWAL